MQVQGINSFNFNNNFKRKQKSIISAKSFEPAKAAETFGLWFGFGVGLDFLSRKIHFSKSPAKNSFAVNGILAALAAGWVIAKDIFDSKSKKDDTVKDV